jgi:SAM-dependent methyltransferase
LTHSTDRCCLCQSSKSGAFLECATDYVTGETFQVRRCAYCGLAFTYPQPVSMDRFYPSRYRRYSWFVQAILEFLYRRRVRSWVQGLGSSGRALEVGCGAGWMLCALRQQGWKVVGNERTFQGAVCASSMNNLPVFVGGLAALKLEPRFDLIILFQVLEHLSDPLETLQQCAMLLKPGGSLVVAVPNLDSWQARLAGPSWYHLDVPRHLFHFSTRSLSTILELVGLTIHRIRFSSLEHDPYGWAQSFLNLLGFRQNLLTKALMGLDRRSVLSPAGFIMAFIGSLLMIPSLLLAVSSWLAEAGALVEIQAVKPVSNC